MSHYIAIEGVIGVGKTSLAKRLVKDLKAKLYLEPVNKVPSIKSFYKNTKKNALTTQLSFFIQRFEQLESMDFNSLFQKDIIMDYIWQKDEIFAKYTLNSEEFELYQTIKKKLTTEIKKPDLVVYLQAPLEVLIHRIEMRNRDYENNISYDYLNGLYKEYTEFFCHYKETPLLIVNAGAIDWVNNEKDYQILKENILSKPIGRNFLNFEPSQLF
ncbi:Deoxyadenosine kinase / Deoxyguanosine kinase [hydrothermal vent metagenome]|uniref:Deoxyadenosine kinase / Deoxyguanosine kinase n=1 Tax=hydrothermal vent metagenome TaxID=652676 RepID=A0A1W1C384_9ZZZZ